MSFSDLREFLAKLEDCGQLVHIHNELFPEPDIRGVCSAASDMYEDGPGIILDNIKGYRGKRLALNVHGSWANLAIMLGMKKNATIREQFNKITKLWDNGSNGELKWVDNAPCQEVVIEKNINLYEVLPLFRINRNDGGFYFSKASVVTQDPDEPDNINKENVGIYRIQVQGPDTVGMQASTFHDIAIHFKKAEERNQPLPVAICLGAPPFVTCMAATPLPYDVSEYKYAAALNSAPLQLTKCIGSNIDVPAGTEYVLEGEIIPRQRFLEGPFGEMPGSYSGIRKQTRIKIKRITHRKDPIFENLYVGLPWTEHDTLIGLFTSVPLYKQLKETMPEVTCVNALYQHGLTIIVSTEQRFGGYAKSVAFRLASTPHGITYAKNIILVDSFVDPFDLNQVMWALSTRLRPEKDVIVIPGTPGHPLDPCSDPPGMGNKLIIDATTPVEPDPFRSFTLVERDKKADEYKKLINQLRK
ncbi:MAG: UbiD family decarboxylase [Peptococcaceae bacterium]|nr:UbiD family decarboxylase [Peptococcaceae bacterium]